MTIRPRKLLGLLLLALGTLFFYVGYQYMQSPLMSLLLVCWVPTIIGFMLLTAGLMLLFVRSV